MTISPSDLRRSDRIRDSRTPQDRLALFVIASLSIIGFALCASQARADTAVTVRSILLFPIANTSGAGDAVGPMIDDAVAMRLATVNKYAIIRYSRLLASVQQGLDDKELTESDVQTPFADDDQSQPRAAKIASRVGADAFFVGSVDSYKADPATRTVSVQVTGNLYSTTTGASIKSVGTSVTGKPIDAGEQLDDVVQGAVNDAASQVASSIDGIPEAGPAVVTTHNNHWSSAKIGSTGTVVIAAVIVGAIIYAASHHDNSSSGSSPSNNNPPPPPAAVKVSGAL
jgi:hypothetical protein